MKTRFKLIRLDDTANWNIADIEKHYGKIYCVYLYDANQVTNCCEITPSYLLFPLYSYAEKEISEAQQDVIDENNIYSDDMYVHCKDIDSVKDKTEHISCNRYGVNGSYSTDEKHEELMEQATGYFRGNWCL